MNGAGDERIQELAPRLWEKEGMPAGRDLDHWLRAEALLAGEVPQGDTTPAEPGGGELLLGIMNPGAGHGPL